MSSSSLDSKKKLIYAGVIGVCLVGAALGYFLQTRDQTSTPAVQQAETKSDEIQKVMLEEAKKMAPKNPPKDIERKPGRGPLKGN